jgi:hypothetical protein
MSHKRRQQLLRNIDGRLSLSADRVAFVEAASQPTGRATLRGGPNDDSAICDQRLVALHSRLPRGEAPAAHEENLEAAWQRCIAWKEILNNRAREMPTAARMLKASSCFGQVRGCSNCFDPTSGPRSAGRSPNGICTGVQTDDCDCGCADRG